MYGRALVKIHRVLSVFSAQAHRGVPTRLVAGARAGVLCAAALAQLALPSGAVAQTADALTEYRNGAFNAAIEICHREIALQPDNLESYVVLCWSLLRLGRYPEAAAGAEKAAALNRYDVRVIEIQGELDYYRGRNDSALLHFQEYVNLAPEGARIETVYYFIGEIYIRLGRFRHADIALSTALHYVPGNPRWWTRLAYAREMSGDAQAAAQAYKTALDLDGSISDAARGLERQRAALERR